MLIHFHLIHNSSRPILPFVAYLYMKQKSLSFRDPGLNDVMCLPYLSETPLNCAKFQGFVSLQVQHDIKDPPWIRAFAPRQTDAIPNYLVIN